MEARQKNSRNQELRSPVELITAMAAEDAENKGILYSDFLTADAESFFCRSRKQIANLLHCGFILGIQAGL